MNVLRFYCNAIGMLIVVGKIQAILCGMDEELGKKGKIHLRVTRSR